MTAEELRHYTSRLVDALKERGAPLSPAAERAFLTVPRHLLFARFWLFNPAGPPTELPHDPKAPASDHLDVIYSNQALGTRFEQGRAVSSSSEPFLMALMLDYLQLAEGLHVLEIGSGTGYNAALISEIVGRQSLVTTVDLRSDIVEEARSRLAATGYGGIAVELRDGFDGAPEHAPLDRIVATVACPDLSPH